MTHKAFKYTSPTTLQIASFYAPYVSFFRKNRKHKDITPLDHILEHAADDIDRDSQINEMHRLINRLDRVEKALILLWLDEYPYDTIASILGIPRNTVASKLHRIKEKLIRYSNQ